MDAQIARAEVEDADDGYAFYLSLDDRDRRHHHDDFGHAFPCSREQLVTLQRLIAAALSGG